MVGRLYSFLVSLLIVPMLLGIIFMLGLIVLALPFLALLNPESININTVKNKVKYSMFNKEVNEKE